MQTLRQIILLLLLAFVLGCSDESSVTKPTDGEGVTTGGELATGITREMISQGRQLLVDKKYEEAISWAKKIEANEPEQLEVQLIMANAQLASGDIDAALKKASMMLTKYPDDPRVITTHALMLGVSGKLDEAIENLESGIKRFDGNEHLHAALTTLYSKAGDDVKAATHFSIVRGINPSYDGIPVSSNFEKFQEFAVDNAKLIITLLIAIITALASD